MSSILIKTINTLIKELEKARDLHGGNTEMQLENFTTTTTTATEDLLKDTPTFMQTSIVKLGLSFNYEIGEIELTPIKEMVLPLAD